MLQVNAALVLGIGICADEIIKQVKELILARCGLETIPLIFQFIVAQEDSSDVVEEALEAVSLAMSASANAEAERSLRLTIDSSSIQIFVIFPLQVGPLNLAMDTLKKLREQTNSGIAGGINAIVLTPKRLLSFDRESFRVAAESLDSSMQKSDVGAPLFPFNRCYFVDEFNEIGQLLKTKDELIEIVGRFIALSVASELSATLKKHPLPYIGEGPHYQAYSSFCCNNIYFRTENLVESLSCTLASDVSQRLFQDHVVSSDDKMIERADHWFGDSITKHLQDTKKGGTTVPAAPATDQVPLGPDRGQLNKEFYDFTHELCKFCLGNMTALQGLIEGCLENGLKRLEQLSLEMVETKKQISELLIRIMLEIPSGAKGEDSYIEENQRTKAVKILIVVLMIAGVITLGGSLAVGANGRLFVLGLGVFLLILSAMLYFFGKTKKRIPISGSRPFSCQAELERTRKRYELQTRVLNEHILMFAHLDLAYANLETLRSLSIPYTFQSPASILDVDLFDERLAALLYSDRLQNKEKDIEAFVSAGSIEKFHEHLLSYPRIELSEVLVEYCRDCLRYLENYSIEQIWEMRESLNSKKDSTIFLSPFWQPISSSRGEKVLIASVDESLHQTIRPLLKGLFRANTVEMVNGPSRNETTVIQISYGLRLADVFVFAQHAN